jgi:hypothetical protein
VPDFCFVAIHAGIRLIDHTGRWKILNDEDIARLVERHLSVPFSKMIE